MAGTSIPVRHDGGTLLNGSSARYPALQRARTRNLQPPLLDKVDDRHDDGRLRQLDAQLFHDRPEVRLELIERLRALPDTEDLKLAITEAVQQ